MVRGLKNAFFMRFSSLPLWAFTLILQFSFFSIHSKCFENILSRVCSSLATELYVGPSLTCMSLSKFWSFALTVRWKVTSVNTALARSWLIVNWEQKSWAVPSRRWSTITLFVGSSLPFTRSWGERASSRWRWGRRGFASSVTQVL